MGENPLLQALRRARREGHGKVVLRVEEAALHRRKVARALLQEGALAAGGQVLDGPGGDLLLVGAEPGRAVRLRTLLERLVGPAAMQILSLERDGGALFAYAAGGMPPPLRPGGDGPGLAGLDAFLDGVPLIGAVRRLQGWTLPDGGQPMFLRLEPDRAWLASALGPLGDDADLMDHAVRRLATRLLAGLADAAEARGLLGPTPPQRLHLPLPASFRPEPSAGAGKGGRLVATLPLSAAAEPDALAARRAELAAAGILLEIEGLDATALEVLDVAALPVELIRLRWSAALTTPWARAALGRIGAGRLILTGATPEAARDLGLGVIEVQAP
jgi:hypothetical protein